MPTVTKNYFDIAIVGDIKEIVFDGPLECGSIYRIEAVTEDGHRIRQEASYSRFGAGEFSCWGLVEEDGSAWLRW